MRGVRTIRSSDAHRARRWDAVVLGSALPGLVAAARLGQRGKRVLVLEEAGWEDAFRGLREPFYLPDADPSGVFGGCLRALGVPLIDQRRFATDDVAFQVVTHDARVEWGRTNLTAAELTAWGLEKPEPARALLRALQRAAEVESDAMLEAPIVKNGRRRRRVQSDGSPAKPAPYARGLPAEVADAPPALRAILAGVARALSNGGAASPAPEARARLLGTTLSGASTMGGRDGGIQGLLRRRAEALFGEFRRIASRFEIVSVASLPGIACEGSDEIFAGRVLILNAPEPDLAAALAGEAPGFLQGATAQAHRVTLHYRADRQRLPEGMGSRLLCLPRGGSEAARNVVALRVLPHDARSVDLVVSAAGPPETAREPAFAAWIDRVVRSLMPFAEESLVAVPAPAVVWDRDDALVSTSPHGSWPSTGDIRRLARPSIVCLDRGITGGLGFEGDLLLGWRAGDAIADELP